MRMLISCPGDLLRIFRNVLPALSVRWHRPVFGKKPKSTRYSSALSYGHYVHLLASPVGRCETRAARNKQPLILIEVDL